MTAGPVLILAAEPSRRAATRATRWWGKAWVRAVEEAAYNEADLAAARTLSRSGRIGRIAVRPGGFAAAVEDPRGLWAVTGTIPALDADALDVLVEVVAADPARVTSLLGGDLTFDLVEHCEELGVELLPFGGELASTCSCEAWVDPCPHALAVLFQLARQVDDDPLLLLHLRGLPRDELLTRLPGSPRSAAGSVTGPAAGDLGVDLDLDVAEEAALRARRWLAELRAQEQEQAQ